MRIAALVISLAVLCGCATALATRTTKWPDGSVTVDTIKAVAFLESIKQGTYSNGNGMVLTVTEATPDQQSIAMLAGTVADLGKTAMLFAVPYTNSPSANSVRSRP